MELGVSVINVFALAFEKLAGSVSPVALAFTLTADTRVAFELSHPQSFPLHHVKRLKTLVPTYDGLLDLVRVRHCEWFTPYSETSCLMRFLLADEELLLLILSPLLLVRR